MSLETVRAAAASTWIPQPWPFVLRKTLSRQIDEALAVPGKVTLLTGPFGVGKTTALKYSKLPALVINGNAPQSVCSQFQRFLPDFKRSASMAEDLANGLGSLPPSVPVIVVDGDRLIDDLPRCKSPIIVELSESIAAVHVKERCDALIEVGDLSEDSVRSLLLPRLISTEHQLDAIKRVCGGRPALLEKLATALDALGPEVAAEKAEDAYLVKTGKTRALASDSSSLEIDALTVKQDRLLEELGSDSSCFADDINRFEDAINSAKSAFEEMTVEDAVLGRVFFLETISQLLTALTKLGAVSVRGPLLELRHPVLVKLLQTDILSVRWTPQPMLIAQSTLTLRLLDSFVHATLEEMSLFERSRYNMVLLKNRVQIRKKLDDVVFLV